MRKNFAVIHPSVIVLFIFSIFFDFFGSLCFVYTVVFLHELAHCYAAERFGVEAEKIIIMPFGMSLRLKDDFIKSPWQEFIISAAGPCANILIALMLKILSDLSLISWEYFSFMLKANLSLAFLNLLPILPLDGGRCLKSLLTLKLGFIRAFNITYLLSRIFIVILTIAGTALLIFTKFNFSLLLISAFLIASAFSQKDIARRIIMHDILSSSKKISDGGKKTELLAASKHDSVSKIINLFSYNKYYVVSVIDDDMSICGFLTETEIIDGALKLDSQIKFKELMR